MSEKITSIEKQSQDFENIKDFKDLIQTMYKYFPNSSVKENIVRKVIFTEDEINHLVNNGFLNKYNIINKNKKENWYSLGANSINLINSWKMEKLTHWIMGLTFITIIISIISLLKSFGVI